MGLKVLEGKVGTCNDAYKMVHFEFSSEVFIFLFVRFSWF